MLAAVYASMFAVFGAVCLGVGFFDQSETRIGDFVLAAACLILAALIEALALTLLVRVQRRNEARELSGTPGKERFFETIWGSVDELQRQRAGRRSRRDAQR